jgi:hypothetical protein
MPGPTRRDLLARAAGAVVRKPRRAGGCVYLALEDARPVGATSVAYSEDPDDGDHIIWYQRT